MQQTKRKTKAKKSKTASLRAARANQTRAVAMPRYDQNDHTEDVVTLANPFSPLARGSRLPDLGASRTVTETCRSLFQINSLATLAGGAIFQGNPKFCTLQASAYTAPDFTMNTNFQAFGTNSTSLATRGRVVSWGIRIMNMQSATGSTGFIALFKAGRVVPSLVLTNNPSLYPTYEIHPLVHGGQWSMVSHARGNDTQNWQNYSADTSGSTAIPPWEVLGVMVFGVAASVPVLQVEIYMNCEYQVDDDNPLAQYAQSQPVYNPQLLAAVNHVQSEHSGIHVGSKEDAGNTIKRVALQAARKHVVPFLKKEAIKAVEKFVL
jgi:hypothetical protein